MPKFKDRNGRDWTLDPTVAAAKRIKDLAGFELLDPDLARTIGRLAADPVLLVDVLYAWVQPQAETRDVTDIDFGEAIAGDTIDHATDALLSALPDFFPGQQNRKNLATLAAKTTNAIQAAENLAAEKLADPRVDQVIQQELAKEAQAIDDRLAELTATPPPPTSGD